jgi:5-methylcytosine-specific restriction endonuclease McrA
MSEQLTLFPDDDRDPLVARARRLARYAAYLQTPHWQGKRAEMLRRQRRCTLCLRRRTLDVHHVTYERIGEELPGDLVVLCERCHHRHHGTNGPGRQRG